MAKLLTLGIDASNLRRGGGITHLVEFLSHANPLAHGVEKVVVWVSRTSLDLLPERQWLHIRCPPALDAGLFRRLFWQHKHLPKNLIDEGCQLLFIPGGAYSSVPCPVVTMCRNMLPFQYSNLFKYRLSLTTLRLLLLRSIQSHSFRNAEGVIFLTRHAADQVQKVLGKLPGDIQIIPHGVNSSFLHSPKPQLHIDSYSSARPFSILYVSIIDVYKYQWNIVAGLGLLREATGWPLVLDLVGPSYPPALSRLKSAMARWDPSGSWVRYHGSIPYSKLGSFYHNADLGVFASTCENMPNILLETMGAGLPVAASNCPPMSTLLGSAGLAFDPLSPVDIALTLARYVADPDLRTRLSNRSFALAKSYSWSKCADQTLVFLSDIFDQQSASGELCAV